MRVAMKRFLMTICLVVLAVSAALAQGKKTVPPPPKPADEGPSLEDTMKFIQDMVSDIGPVNVVEHIHDDSADNDWTQLSKYEFTKVVANPGACLINYHWKTQTSGTVTADSDFGIFLKDVEDIAVMPMEQYLKEVVTAAGHPSWSFRVDSPVFVLKVRRTDSKETNVFDFFDEQLANRVAKAMVHAVELCGGGSTPEPF